MRGKLFQIFLDPDNFSNQFVSNFNLGPLKDLDGLIDEVLALDSAKSYLRKQVKIERTTTGALNKIAALATFQKKVTFSSIILEIQLRIGIKNRMI